MKRKIPVLFVLLFSAASTAAIDTGSDAYNAGQMAGYVFLAVLAVLILRKLFKK